MDSVSFMQQIKYSLPIGISSYLGILGKQIDQYLISIFFSPSQFAVYSRGSLSVPLINDFQYMIHDILMPKYVTCFSSGQIKQLLKMFHVAADKVAKVKFPAFCFLFATAPHIIRLLYTNRFDDAIPVMRIYLFLLPMGVTVYGAIPRATGKTSCITWSTALAIVANIIISLLLLPVLGPAGAALGTILSSSVVMLFLIITSCKILGIRVKNFLPWKGLVHILLISFISSVPLYLPPLLVNISHSLAIFQYLICSIVFYAYIWCALMMRQHLFHREDLETMSRWLRIDMIYWLPRLSFCKFKDK